MQTVSTESTQATPEPNEEQRIFLEGIAADPNGMERIDGFERHLREFAARDARLLAEVLRPFEELAKSYEAAESENVSRANQARESGRPGLFHAHLGIAGHCSTFASELRAALEQARKPTPTAGGLEGTT